MSDLSQRLSAFLTECLRLPHSRESEIQNHADRILASIKAGASTDALRKQVAKIQLALANVVKDADCGNAVMRARALVARDSN